MNGTDTLIKLFGTDENENEKLFIQHFVECTKFFRPEIVRDRAEFILYQAGMNNQLPVRYSQNMKKYFSSKDGYIKAIKNRKQAKVFSEGNDLTHLDRKIRVICDSTGNKSVVDCIKDYTNYSISTGKSSDLINYTISHVWAKTDDPFFFTSLWNVVIVPAYLSFLLDKPKDQHQINSKIQGIIRAVCIELYNPNVLMNIDVVDNESEDNKITAKGFIDKGIINYLDKKNLLVKPLPIIKENTITLDKNQYTNKEFIMSLLSKLDNSNGFNFIKILTNPVDCKKRFDLSFPLLKEYNLSEGDTLFFDDADNIRYYKKDTFFENNQKRYIICNHWFPKQRELFELWVYNNINSNQ